MAALSPLAAPPPSDPEPLPGDLPFTARDFDRIAAFAYREFGLSLQPSKKNLVYSRLVKRLRALNLPGFQPYCDLIESPEGAAEHEAIVSALTTNVTHFFRETHHFDLLAQLAVKPRLQALRGGERMRIWSAGCSAGMEPYSIAMTLLDALPEAAQLNIRILATDVDPVILTRARDARFSAEEVQPIPDRMKPWALGPAEAGRHRIAPKVAQMVRFAELNLMQDWPVRGPFDVIFCRNVAIYFDKPTQARLWQRFAGLLAPGGLLFIGHSERLGGPAESSFTSVGTTAYRKKNPGKETP
jgi:chemotaxis protein methyltransferase CheR